MSEIMRIAEFEKVSYEQFSADVKANFPALTDEKIRFIYDNIKLPRRATSGSAGYDFYLPMDILNLAPDMAMSIPTGIRARIKEGWVLMCCPRSGLGFRFRMRLSNTVGIIDSDYYNAKNEGHIIARISNETNENKTISLEAGSAFIQGIFLPFGITESDDAEGERTGGFGSTSEKK
ncbi:MAG: deoxyuridine 5'-triphosphate nucleotidohydrolase [Huintestinicola sp.]